MNPQIENLVNDQIKLAKQNSVNLTSDRAFDYALVALFSGLENFYDIDSCVTDGKSDGGIDFIILDDDNDTLVVGQSKMTEGFDANSLFKELDKMHSTVLAFQNKEGMTTPYNDKLRKALRNGLDSLPDDGSGKIEYRICTSADINGESLLKKLDDSERPLNSESVSLYSEKEITDEIDSQVQSSNTVAEFKFELDQTKNYVHYETENIEGVIVNIKSTSLRDLYEKFNSEGLFDLNIRKYIKNKSVDSGIKRTLDKNRDEFWFLNNGLTIVCSDFTFDGDRITLYDFSIVNGGQTTYLIANYSGSNTETFYIPCKVVANKNSEDINDEGLQLFYNRIAEATNSQKQITPIDLKANYPEMRTLKKLFDKRGINFEIKRGDKAPSHLRRSFTIKNVEFAQLYESFVYQQPGTARSNKKSLFENNDSYSRIFRKKYEKNKSDADFIVDLVDLYERFLGINNKLKGTLEETENDVLSNGKFAILALFGALYSIVNKDAKIAQIESDPIAFASTEFCLDSFISNYTGDDIESNMETVIRGIVRSMTQTYKGQLRQGECTSASNFLKTDPKYQQVILPEFMYWLKNTDPGEAVLKKASFLKRVN